MAKYDPLNSYLEQRGDRSISLTFSEVEKIINAKLPKSALDYREWWANDRSHTQARAWLAAGYKTSDVNMTA